MTATGRLAVSRLLPVLPYRDPAAAIIWLSRAFGFETQSLVSGADGAFQYALMSFGGTGIMITGAPKGTGDGEVAPGADPSSCYFVVGDADAHYAAAKAHGAGIVFALHDMDHGGRGYSCRDLEGRVWSFGTFDPCRGTAISARPPLEPEPQQPVSHGPQAAPRRARAHWGLVSGLGGVLFGSAVAAAWFNGGMPQDAPEVAAAWALTQAEGELARERHGREAAEKAIAAVRARLAQEQSARESAERAKDEARTAADRERAAKEEARNALTEAQSKMAALEREKARARAAKPEGQQQAKPEAQTDRERAARQAAEAALEAANKQLAEERTAREAAERASLAVQAELERERNAKAQAWKTVSQLRRQISQRAAAGAASGAAPATADAPPASKNADPQYNGPLSPF